ncbi:MAG: histidine phosphatase family protein [Bdellovibrionales bacterium]|nr:histidine phosphatase family protein [Bdellovibrionales bacterium]
MNLTLLCIRHGQTDWNVEGRYCGQTDISINEAGRKAAERLAQELSTEQLDAVYASDLQRAAETARILARPHGLEVQIDARLRELDQGKWEGLLFSEIKDVYSEELANRKLDPLSFRAPDGETVQEMLERVTEAIEEIRRRHQAGGRVLVVAHGFTLALVRVRYMGIELARAWDYVPPNTEVVEIHL